MRRDRSDEQAFEQVKQELESYIVDHNRYEKIESIGKGGYGTCFLATDTETGKKVALKEIHLEELSGSALEGYCREVRVLSKCSHPCLLPLIGFTITSPFAIITEFMCNGSLYDWIRGKEQKLTGTQKTLIAMGIAAGMARLHEQNVVHRDLKSLNVLLDENMLPKICDFGISTVVETGSTVLTTRRIGTPAWTAPEMFDGGGYTNKVDVYSYGMVLYEMVSGEQPFRGMKGIEILKAVVERQERPRMPIRAPHQLKKLMQICWNANPSKRPSFETIYELFASEKAQFPDTDVEEVRKYKNMLNEWRSSHKLTDPKSVDSVSLNFDVMKQVLKSQDQVEIFGLTSSINVDNFGSFLNVVYELIRENEPKPVIQSALFDLLVIITEQEDCLVEFGLKSEFMNFSYDDPELRDLSLSLYIPVCEKLPNSISDSYIDFLQSMIPKAPLKVMRMFSMLVESYKDSNINWVVCDLLCVKSQVFLMNGAGNALLQTLYRMVDHLEEFRKSRSQICVTIFAGCLNSPEEHIIELALNALLAMRPQNFPCTAETVLSLLNNPEHRSRILQLLCVSCPSSANMAVFKLLLDLSFEVGEAAAALISMLQNPEFGDVCLEEAGMWLNRRTIDVGLRLQMVMSAMLSPANRKKVTQVPGMATFLNECIEDKDLEKIEVMCTVIRRTPVDKQFVQQLAAAGFIRNYLTTIREINFEHVYRKGYLVIDYLCRRHYVDDFLIFLPAAIEHLRTYPNLRKFAATYLALMSCYKDATTSLIEDQVYEALKSLVESHELISKTLDNISHLTAA